MSALVIFTSLGGTSYPWGSPFMVGLAVAGVVLGVLFVLAERRAVEPVLPLDLFANRVFSAASAIGFVVGFAMFGALTFLPLFFQVVKGVSPTASGLRLFPMMGGLLVASIGSGQIVSRWGRYKVFPVVGTALMTLGLFAMSHIGVTTGEAVIAAYMVVFGLGLGLVMQVLVVSVQNAVSYEELGTATSGVTFFRSIGGSFGTAVFGAIFANVLAGNLATQLRMIGITHIPGGAAAGIDNPALVARLPDRVHQAVSVAIADSIDRVFLIGVPIGLLAFGLSWLLPEIELRKSVRTNEPGEGFTPPRGRTSLEELQLNLERIVARETPGRAVRDAGPPGRPRHPTPLLLAALPGGRRAGLHGRHGGDEVECAAGHHRAGNRRPRGRRPRRRDRRGRLRRHPTPPAHPRRGVRRGEVGRRPAGRAHRTPRRLGPRHQHRGGGHGAAARPRAAGRRPEDAGRRGHAHRTTLVAARVTVPVPSGRRRPAG